MRYNPETRQTADEEEDIGVIAEAGASSSDGKTYDGKTAKGTVPPEAPSPFRLNVGARAQYTSNAELSGNHDSNDVIFFPTIEAGYHTALGKQFSYDAALRLESGIYSDRSNRSFIGYSLQNTLDFRPKPNLPRVFIGAEPYRYDNFDRQGLITEAISVNGGADYGLGFNNGNSLAFVGYTFANHFSNPRRDSRRSNTAMVGLTHTFKPQLYGQLFYQYEYSDFYTIEREDNRHVLGVSLTYQINRHLFTTLSGNFTDNNSTDARAAYQGAGASFGLNLQY